MLPLQLSFASDAIISSDRATAFLQLPEKDFGVIVRLNDLNMN